MVKTPSEERGGTTGDGKGGTSPGRGIRQSRPARALPSAQRPVEEVDGPLPCQRGCRFIVTGRRVVVEPVVDALVHVHREGLAVGL